VISVNDALNQLFALAQPPQSETVSLRHSVGRVMLGTAIADRDQPPFAASAMDGYALRDADVSPGVRLSVVGTAAAGTAWTGTVSAGQAVRIFTGAPVPNGADRVVIQEDVTADGDHIQLNDQLDTGFHIRPAGADFSKGDRFGGPHRLRPVDLARLAAMNVPEVTVARRPDVAVIATGDELVMPDEQPRDDQIVASNSFALAAMIDTEGGTARMLPIARDTDWALNAAFEQASEADLIVTIGGASVGDHDLVGQVAASRGMTRSFYKIAMRPGKPLMSGQMGHSIMLGLPGNPVSSIVCGHVFLIPLLRAMQGLPACPAERLDATLAMPVAANGPREHYMRAFVGPEGLRPFDRQDSSLLSVLGDANALLIRPPNDTPRQRGEFVNYIPI
jgi:molybdopterin molybdotransferase